MSAALRLSHHWIELAGLSVHYVEAGKGGDPVIFLHGGSYDEATLSWRPVLEGFSPGYRLLGPDLPGFGRSGNPTMACSSGYLIGFLEQFVTALGLRRFSLVGLSLGGMISLGYALRHQESLRALVLVGSAGLSSEIRWRWTANAAARIPHLYQGISRFLVTRPSLLKKVLRLYVERPADDELCEAVLNVTRTRSQPVGWKSFLRCEVTWQGFRTTYEKGLGTLGVPTLLIHGSCDRLVPPAHSLRAHRKIPSSRLEILDRCGHWVPRERPREFVGLVTSFLGSVPP